MNRVVILMGVLLAGALAAGAQSEVVIESFRAPGQIVFRTVSGASQYRVEWSSAVGASWTNFALSQLDAIVSPGPGAVIASVPMRYRVVATVTSAPSPRGMVLIQAGSFVMGSGVHAGQKSHPGEIPQHTVYVSAFFMDVHEVTQALWDSVTNHGGGNGYTYTHPGSGKATNHPVHTVNWFDVVKWCNARSQRDGLTPVYYTDAAFATVYKTGEIEPCANWAANGYRLPTEAEWEKAARGGATGTRFPWTDYTNKISWAKANYYGDSYNRSYDLNGESGAYHPAFATGGYPYTSPAGFFAPNGYGLYDMAGNVWEWCWDGYDRASFARSSGPDPKGPAGPLAYRVLRGGSWSSDAAIDTRCAFRSSGGYPVSEGFDFGFRCARGL